MKFATAALGGLLLAVSPLAAMAEGLNYSYVELDYVDVNVDDGPSGDGLRRCAARSGSPATGSHLPTTWTPKSTSSTSRTSPSASAAISRSTPAWTSSDASATRKPTCPRRAFSVSDDGYLLTAGLRGQVSQFEAEGHIVYTDLSDGGDETAFEFTGRYNFTEMFSAGVAYRMGDDADVLFAGVRLSW